MKLWQEVLVNKWERLNNPSVMGSDVARKAGQLADFFRNLQFLAYDTYVTNQFGDYAESAIRGFQCNEQAYDDMHITTTLDLHDVQCTSYGLHSFDNYMCDMWKDYFMYALKKGI